MLIMLAVELEFCNGAAHLGSFLEGQSDVLSDVGVEATRQESHTVPSRRRRMTERG